MRATLLILLVAGVVTPVAAHHPDRECQPVTPVIDLIPPLGNRLPEEYRRQYNRPTYLGGRIAYKIAPSSQEAMAWHRAEHRGDYDCDRGRVVPTYFYLKPYEAMRIGSRRSVKPEFQPEPSMDTEARPLATPQYDPSADAVSAQDVEEMANRLERPDTLDVDGETDSNFLELEPIRVEAPSVR